MHVKIIQLAMLALMSLNSGSNIPTEKNGGVLVKAECASNETFVRLLTQLIQTMIRNNCIITINNNKNVDLTTH